MMDLCVGLTALVLVVRDVVVAALLVFTDRTPLFFVALLAKGLLHLLPSPQRERRLAVMMAAYQRRRKVYGLLVLCPALAMGLFVVWIWLVS